MNKCTLQMYCIVWDASEKGLLNNVDQQLSQRTSAL